MHKLEWILPYRHTKNWIMRCLSVRSKHAATANSELFRLFYWLSWLGYRAVFHLRVSVGVPSRQNNVSVNVRHSPIAAIPHPLWIMSSKLRKLIVATFTYIYTYPGKQINSRCWHILSGHWLLTKAAVPIAIQDPPLTIWWHYEAAW